jgi:hypothetical protein
MGKRQCELHGCTKQAAQGGTPYCIAHGGGKRCTYGLGCTKSAVSGGTQVSGAGEVVQGRPRSAWLLREATFGLVVDRDCPTHRCARRMGAASAARWRGALSPPSQAARPTAARTEAASAVAPTAATRACKAARRSAAGTGGAGELEDIPLQAPRAVRRGCGPGRIG